MRVYLVQTHPNVPVVENLEDIWMVSKLQQQRKAKEAREKAKRLQVGSPLNEDDCCFKTESRMQTPQPIPVPAGNAKAAGGAIWSRSTACS